MGLPATIPPMYPHAVDLVLSVWATVSALPGKMPETISSIEAVVLIQHGSHQLVQTFVSVVGAAIIFSKHSIHGPQHLADQNQQRLTISTAAKDFGAVQAAQANIAAGAPAMIAAAIQPIYSRLAVRTL